jgi:hypothetical protein
MMFALIPAMLPFLQLRPKGGGCNWWYGYDLKEYEAVSKK